MGRGTRRTGQAPTSSSPLLPCPPKSVLSEHCCLNRCASFFLRAKPHYLFLFDSPERLERNRFARLRLKLHRRRSFYRFDGHKSNSLPGHVNILSFKNRELRSRCKIINVEFAVSGRLIVPVHSLSLSAFEP